MSPVFRYVGRSGTRIALLSPPNKNSVITNPITSQRRVQRRNSHQTPKRPANKQPYFHRLCGFWWARQERFKKPKNVDLFSCFSRLPGDNTRTFGKARRSCKHGMCTREQMRPLAPSNQETQDPRPASKEAIPFMIREPGHLPRSSVPPRRRDRHERAAPLVGSQE